jgi:hypothetical protein
MKPKILVLWHEPSDMLATCEINESGFLPLLAVCDEEFNGINPFYSYPLNWLTSFGWLMVGEL